MVKFRSATHADKQILDDFLQGIITAERPMDRSLTPGHITYYEPMGLVDDPQAVLIVAEIDENAPVNMSMTIATTSLLVSGDCQPWPKNVSYSIIF